MSSNDAKKGLFAQFATVAKALSHGNRLELLELLAQGERSVEALSKLTGMSVANTSQHLRHLQRPGLVTARKSGHYVLYRLNDEDVVLLLSLLRDVAKRNVAEVDKLIAGYFRSRDSFEAVSQEELLLRAQEGLVTVLDVRPPEEFAAGHLPNAINIPLKELKLRLDEIPKDLDVVAYCRGPYCVLAFEAVAELRDLGYTAQRLEAGLPEWKLAGLPIEFNESNTR